MPEITTRRSGEFVRGIFSLLLGESEGMRAKDVLTRLSGIVPPTEFEKGIYPKNPNVRRYERIARFSTIGPVKAGWLVKNKGHWSLTDEGRNAFERFTDPEELYREAGRLYRKWAAERPVREVDEESEESSEQTVTTLEEAEELAWSELEAHLDQMNPYDFQDLVAGLLRGMGYHVDWISPPGPDRGIDIIAHVDPLGVTGPRIKVQVKRRQDKVAVDGVRGFMALLGDSDIGLFVNSGGFTRDAEDEARRQEKRRIMLLDSKRLFDLWTEYYERIPETQRRLLPLHPVYYLAPDE